MKDVLNFEELKAKGEMTPIPGFDPEMYLCHCQSGNLYSLVSRKWLLQSNPKGTGDNGKYLMTTLTMPDGEKNQIYLHECVISSCFGIQTSEWKAMGLECDHISLDTRDNSISNLRLVNSKQNKENSSYRGWNKTRLSFSVAQQLRREAKQWSGRKIEFYKLKGKELGVTSRSIQNIILGYTYKNNEEVA
ncbi:hypothetical protein ABTI76_001028 [Bacillus cereus]